MSFKSNSIKSFQFSEQQLLLTAPKSSKIQNYKIHTQQHPLSTTDINFYFMCQNYQLWTHTHNEGEINLSSKLFFCDSILIISDYDIPREERNFWCKNLHCNMFPFDVSPLSSTHSLSLFFLAQFSLCLIQNMNWIFSKVETLDANQFHLFDLALPPSLSLNFSLCFSIVARRNFHDFSHTLSSCVHP